MANEVVDLWPPDLVVSGETSPALLLRQQAERLRGRTNGRVEAEVVTKSLAGGRLIHRFSLKAPGLGEYTHTLFYVVHRKQRPYPVEIHLFAVTAQAEASAEFTCKDQESFEATLRDLFASPGTRKTIDSLLAA
jgi:hypothetical protein